MTYFDIMTDTMRQCETHPQLRASINHAIRNQALYVHEVETPTHIIPSHPIAIYHLVSGERSFEAARKYSRQRVAVLNFANCRSIGGNPYYANAQEECLCRCSTLLPCLQAMKSVYYDRHQQLIQSGRMNYLGNDDIIYTPHVTVFKTDEDFPQPLPESAWYHVDVITCAAPELWNHRPPSNYETIIMQRLRRVLDLAAAYDIKVLILGAWGCGAFQNPPLVVANVFMWLLMQYEFSTVEFAMGSTSSENYKIFQDIIKDKGLTYFQSSKWKRIWKRFF